MAHYATHGLTSYVGTTIPRPVYGPHLHEVRCGGLDFGIRRRCGHVIDSRVPIIRDVVARIYDNEDHWANKSQITTRVLTYEETVSLIAFGAKERAALKSTAAKEGGAL